MAKGQTVADLKINLEADLGDLEILRKELKQVSKESNFTNKNFEQLIGSIKDFGKTTRETTIGIKGQIASFEKLRTRVDFQSQAYKDLTGEISALNKELKTRLTVEKELEASFVRRGKGRIAGPGPGDAAILGTGFSSVKSNQDFQTRQAALQGLFLQRTFSDLRDDQKDYLNKIELKKAGTFRLDDFRDNLDFKKFIEGINASYLTAESQRKGSGKDITGKVFADLQSKKGALNEVQLQALNIQDRSNIRSKGYLEVLTKINAEEAARTQILGAQNTNAANQIAQMEAKKLITNKLITQQEAQAKSFLYQKDRGTFLDNVLGPKGQATFYDPKGKAHVGYGTQAFRQMPGFTQRLMSIANMVGIKSPTYSLMEEELTGGYKKDFFKDRTATYFPKNIGEYKVSGKKVQQAMFDFPFKGKKFPVEPFDPFGTGKAQAYPKTDRGLAAELGNLKGLLPDLVRGSDEWVKVTELAEEKQKELDKTIEKGNKALKKRRDEIAKAVNPRFNQKLLPPGKPTAAEILPGQKFTAPEVKKVAKSVQELTNEVEKNTKIGNININTLTKQRSNLENIRNGLDPTSAAFKRITNAIQQTDKALSRLNNNKFSGANLARTGQAVLGAGFFGGPAGFLGAGIGAGVNALRPGGDMQQGAITGGLVASQVLNPVAQFASGSATYASEIEKAKTALRGITKDQESYEIALAAAAKATKEFNVPQEVAIRGVTRLSAAVLGAGGNVHNATEAFLNTTAAIKGTAGSADDVKSAITAMVQIFSKGKVSAEELSGQLGERFPAAVTKFADANKISTQELQASLKQGTVGLDMLSKFIESLGEEYTELAKTIAASSDEAGARAAIAWRKFRLDIGGILREIGAEYQESFEVLLKESIPLMKSLFQSLAEFGRGLIPVVKLLAGNFQLLADMVILTGAAFVGLKIQATVVAIKNFTSALKGATIAQKLFNISVQVNPYVMAATGIAALILLLRKLETRWSKTAAAMKESLFGLTEEEAGRKHYKNLGRIRELEWMRDNTIGGKVMSGWINNEIEMLKKENKALYEYITAEHEAKDKGKKHTFAGFSGDGSTLQTFWEGLTNGAKHAEEVFTGAFKKMEDSLTEFVMTGKLNFKSFARSVIADMARMIIKAAILGPLFKWIAPVESTGWFSNAKKNAKGNIYGQNGIVPFARGGIVDSPTLFPFANGAGLMGEAGPEAIIPLKRGRDGKLGIAGGGGTNIAVNVDASGSSVEGDDVRSREFGALIGAAIQAEIVSQKRPGGLLA